MIFCIVTKLRHHIIFAEVNKTYMENIFSNFGSLQFKATDTAAIFFVEKVH